MCVSYPNAPTDAMEPQHPMLLYDANAERELSITVPGLPKSQAPTWAVSDDHEFHSLVRQGQALGGVTPAVNTAWSDKGLMEGVTEEGGTKYLMTRGIDSIDVEGMVGRHRVMYPDDAIDHLAQDLRVVVLGRHMSAGHAVHAGSLVDWAKTMTSDEIMAMDAVLVLRGGNDWMIYCGEAHILMRTYMGKMYGEILGGEGEGAVTTARRWLDGLAFPVRMMGHTYQGRLELFAPKKDRTGRKPLEALPPVFFNFSYGWFQTLERLGRFLGNEVIKQAARLSFSKAIEKMRGLYKGGVWGLNDQGQMIRKGGALIVGVVTNEGEESDAEKEYAVPWVPPQVPPQLGEEGEGGVPEALPAGGQVAAVSDVTRPTRKRTPVSRLGSEPAEPPKKRKGGRQAKPVAVAKDEGVELGVLTPLFALLSGPLGQAEGAVQSILDDYHRAQNMGAKKLIVEALVRGLVDASKRSKEIIDLTKDD